MAILIIIGTTIVVGTVIYRLYARFNPPPTPSATSGSIAAPVASPALPTIPAPTVQLADGEHITAIAAAGADVAILVAGPQSERVLILNPASGAIRTALVSHPHTPAAP